jgi:hypothetical protein
MSLFTNLFNMKYDELQNDIEKLIFSNKYTRFLEYLKKEAMLKNTKMLQTTH